MQSLETYDKTMKTQDTNYELTVHKILKKYLGKMTTKCCMWIGVHILWSDKNI